MHIIYKVEAKEFCCLTDHVPLLGPLHSLGFRAGRRYFALPYAYTRIVFASSRCVAVWWFDNDFVFCFFKPNEKKIWNMQQFVQVYALLCAFILYLCIMCIFCLLQLRCWCFFSIFLPSLLRNGVLLWLLFILFRSAFHSCALKLHVYVQCAMCSWAKLFTLPKQ